MPVSNGNSADVHARTGVEPASAFQCALAVLLFPPFVTFAVLGFPLLALSRSAAAKGEFAWFLVALLLASPNTASYTFILSLLPATLLMESAGRWKGIVLLACYVALTIPMRPSGNWLFPKVLFLVTLFVLAGLGYGGASIGRWHLSER